MNAANYQKYLNFMTRLESVASPKEKVLINQARGMFAKMEGTAATMDRSTANYGKSPSLNTFGSAGKSKIKELSPEEAAAQKEDRDAREAQWAKQAKTLEKKANTAKETLLKYAQLEPAKLDVWVEKTLEPAIEDYLNSEEGGLEWETDENGKKVVVKKQGVGGFVTPEMKKAKYKEDRKAELKAIRDQKKAAAEAEKAKAAETAAAEEPKKEKKRGFFGRLKDAAKATKDAILGKEAALGGMEPQMASVSDKDLRTCFESVFGDSSSLTDESIRAICYNAVDRMTRE